jgi:hypothetical protein
MKTIIEFELPADEDAYRDALEGTKWKDFVCDIEQFLILLEATEANTDAQRAYRAVLQRMRHERALAGLTFCAAAKLRQLRAEHGRQWSEQLDAHLRTKGLACAGREGNP